MVEVQMTEQGTLEFLVDKMDVITGLLALGFTFALVIMVMTAGVKAGWKLWPWILGLGLLTFLLN